jgi:hypothetical protein
MAQEDVRNPDQPEFLNDKDRAEDREKFAGRQIVETG